MNPLGLTGTSFAQPASADSEMVSFDPITSFYSAPQFDRAADTGYYNSLNDVIKIGLSILNSTLLSPAQTRSWLKPRSFASNINDIVTIQLVPHGKSFVRQANVSAIYTPKTVNGLPVPPH
jgi:CubicO group peptidase (beta-lactamase class C family)